MNGLRRGRLDLMDISVKRRGTRTALLMCLLAMPTTIATGCSTHREAVSHPCTTVTKGGKVIAVENRGAIAMAKVGLTPNSLKAQEKCK